MTDFSVHTVAKPVARALDAFVYYDERVNHAEEAIDSLGRIVFTALLHSANAVTLAAKSIFRTLALMPLPITIPLSSYANAKDKNLGDAFKNKFSLYGTKMSEYFNGTDDIEDGRERHIPGIKDSIKGLFTHALKNAGETVKHTFRAVVWPWNRPDFSRLPFRSSGADLPHPSNGGCDFQTTVDILDPGNLFSGPQTAPTDPQTPGVKIDFLDD